MQKENLTDKIMNSGLLKFFKDSNNSVSRENIFNHLLCYDLKIAAARRGYDLQIYQPDVDRDGFDLILDDRDTMLPIQVKTVFGKTRVWEIKKRLLRPKWYLCEQLGFETSPYGVGLNGGILLIDIKVATDEAIAVDYFYTDVFIMRIMQLGIIQKINGISQFWKDLVTGLGDDKVEVKKAFFLKAKGHEQLLELMGLHSNFLSSHQDYILKFYERQSNKELMIKYQKTLAEEIRKSLLELVKL